VEDTLSKHQRSREELLDHLKDQVQFLQASCAAYDNGFHSEAKRMAVVIRILLHDTSRSVSLLKQLDSKRIRFLDTALPVIKGNLISHQGLTMIRAGSDGAIYVPRCLAPPNPIVGPPKPRGFGTWWNAVVVIDQSRTKFTRKDLVLTLSNKEGGAHVDPALDSRFAALIKEHSMGWMFESADKDEPIEAIELASVRQIAQEVFMSLERAFPDLMDT
jgi:hypothetical protein